jgi:hypothetical protein
MLRISAVRDDSSSANPIVSSGAIGPDLDDRVVANAIAGRDAAGGQKRSCGPRQPDARDWANAGAGKVRPTVSWPTADLTISER